LEREHEPKPEDVAACLRVLAAAGANPDDPAFLPVLRAAEQVHRARKKKLRAGRKIKRAEHDRAAIATARRFAEENPSPDAAPVLPPPGRTPVLLRGTRRCYVCKAPYSSVDSEYHQLCPGCAADNTARRFARCDLRGRHAIVTGGRVKIGFHTALKLLRDGADVLVTTRFPHDAARRFAAVADAPDWLDRLHVHGVDFLDLDGVAGLLAAVTRRWAHLDILVNNAAQTVRRPPEYHREVRARESAVRSGAAAAVDVVAVRPRVAVLSGTGAVCPSGGLGGVELAAVELSTVEALFPAGRVDETGEPLDLREVNSWSLRLHQVSPQEWLETHVINGFVPFLLTGRLRPMMLASPHPDRYVVQVSAMEGSFGRSNKTSRHPHTNMAKAGLNMLTRTVAAEYATEGIHMNSVDTGWVTDERPHPDKLAQRGEGFRPPLDVIDGAARVYDPIVRGVRGEPVSGLFLKDYRPVEW
jgi:NAD(P)-dependent dehydrogenase (short-subunit alcohol dehydrogenase family)